MESKFLPKIPKRKVSANQPNVVKPKITENVNVESVVEEKSRNNAVIMPAQPARTIEKQIEPTPMFEKTNFVEYEKLNIKNINDDNLSATVMKQEDKPQSFTFLFSVILCCLVVISSIYMLASLDIFVEIKNAFTSSIEVALNYAFLFIGILILLIIGDVVLIKNLQGHSKNYLTQKTLVKRMIWSSIVLLLGFALVIFGVKNIDCAIWPILPFILGILTFIAFIYSVFLKIRNMLK